MIRVPEPLVLDTMDIIKNITKGTTLNNKNRTPNTIKKIASFFAFFFA